MLEDDLDEAILELCLCADQRSDLPDQLRRHVDRLRELRDRLKTEGLGEAGEWTNDEAAAAEAAP